MATQVRTLCGEVCYSTTCAATYLYQLADPCLLPPQVCTCLAYLTATARWAQNVLGLCRTRCGAAAFWLAALAI